MSKFRFKTSKSYKKKNLRLNVTNNDYIGVYEQTLDSYIELQRMGVNVNEHVVRELLYKMVNDLYTNHIIEATTTEDPITRRVITKVRLPLR
jgi:3-deoxy-D-arabino-heptulosonate 7-phosphate (DAHP) synthase